MTISASWNKVFRDPALYWAKHSKRFQEITGTRSSNTVRRVSAALVIRRSDQAGLFLGPMTPSSIKNPKTNCRFASVTVATWPASYAGKWSWIAMMIVPCHRVPVHLLSLKILCKKFLALSLRGHISPVNSERCLTRKIWLFLTSGPLFLLRHTGNSLSRSAKQLTLRVRPTHKKRLLRGPKNPFLLKSPQNGLLPKLHKIT